MSKMVSIVEGAIAEAVIVTGDREFISKIGLFIESHPGLIGRAAIEAMREPADIMISALRAAEPGLVILTAQGSTKAQDALDLLNAATLAAAEVGWN